MNVPLSVLIVCAAVVALLMLSGLVLMWLGSVRFRFTSGYNHGVTGELGGGKSSFVVAKVAVPAARAIVSKGGLHCSITGRKVYRIITNFEFHPEVFGIEGCEVHRYDPESGFTFWQFVMSFAYVDSYGDIRIDAVVLCDEMSIFAPSSDMVVDEKAHNFVIHSRKWNCMFYWMAQDAMQVHKRIRDRSQRIWYCQPKDTVVSALWPVRLHTAGSYMPIDIGKVAQGMPLKSIDRRTFAMTRKVRESYNSFETITDRPTDQEDIIAARALRELRDGVPDTAVELEMD